MKVLILGSSGMLGSYLVSSDSFSEFEVITHSKSQQADYTLDLLSKEESCQMVEQVRPDVIINLVALTNVDYCEYYPDQAFKINVSTIQNIVDAVNKIDSKIKLIHISTDQLYDGETVSKEADIIMRNYYTMTKYTSELVVQTANAITLRTNFFGKSTVSARQSFTDWLFKNLIEQNEIDVFDDVAFSPLSLQSLSNCLKFLCTNKNNGKGIYNVGSHLGMSKAEFAFKFAQLVNLNTINLKVTSIDNRTDLKATRPKNMRMDLTLFEESFNWQFPNLVSEIQSVSKEYLR